MAWNDTSLACRRYLGKGKLTRSEATLIRSDQCIEGYASTFISFGYTYFFLDIFTISPSRKTLSLFIRPSLPFTYRLIKVYTYVCMYVSAARICQCCRNIRSNLIAAHKLEQKKNEEKQKHNNNKKNSNKAMAMQLCNATENQRKDVYCTENLSECK